MNQVSIGSDHGLVPYWHQAITWTSADLLSIGPIGTNLREIWIQILTFSFKKIRLKMLSAKMVAILSRGRWVNCLAPVEDLWCNESWHDDVIKGKHFPRNWPFVQGIHRCPVNSPHKGQWRRAFDVFFDLRLNTRVNNREAGDWRCHHAHYDVTVM